MEELIQTDAAINQVIAINTAIVRGSGMGGPVAEGLGFAIPSNVVEEVTQQLIEYGHVRRPYLSVEWVPITPRVAPAYNLPVQFGAYVQDVQPGSPADT